MDELIKTIKNKAVDIINDWFLSRYTNILLSYPQSVFANGGFLLFAFKSEYDQFPVEISRSTKPMVLPVFMGDVEMYNQPFSNQKDMVDKIKAYYYELLCNDENIKDYIDYINSEEYIESYELENKYRGDFESEPAKDILFDYIIGNKTFAIEFTSGFNLSPIGVNS